MSKNNVDITPPEGVPISLAIASVGARFGAQTLDFLITFGGLFLFVLGLIWINVLDWALMGTLFFLLIFFVRVPYYVFTELVWNGRTLGKRIVKIRVISGWHAPYTASNRGAQFDERSRSFYAGHHAFVGQFCQWLPERHLELPDGPVLHRFPYGGTRRCLRGPVPILPASMAPCSRAWV